MTLAAPVAAPEMRSRRLLWLAAGALVFALLLFAKYRQPDTSTVQIVGHALASPAGTDSSLYMNMGEDAFRAPGHRIFPKLFFEEHQKYIYPPSSLFLIEAMNRAPAVGLSVDGARRGLMVLNWLATLAVAVLFFRALRGGVTALEAAAVVVLGVLFLPIAEAFYRGQVQIVLTFLWGLSALLWQRERRGWAGFVLALTCAFKPQLALFLLWGALRKEWRFTAIFAATLAVITGCSLAHFGVQNNLDYLPVLSYLSRHGEALWANQSMNGLMNRLLRNGDPTGWNATVYPPYRAGIYMVSTLFMVVGTVVGLALPWRKKWAGTTADFLFFGGVSVVISPIAWEHHYGAFYFLLIFLLAHVERLTRARWALLVVCTLGMANRIPPLDHRMNGLSSFFGAYLFYTGLAVLGLVAMEAGEAVRGERAAAGLKVKSSY
jgi:alpha-1,2-mannosyltransferase